MKRRIVLLITTLAIFATLGFAQASDTINGYVTYHKSSTTLDSITVTLKNASNAVVASTMTDANGFYEFTNVGNGTYSLELSTNRATGGVTISDAMQVLFHILIPNYMPFTNMQKIAADVNDNGLIQWNDFFGILNIISGQSAGGWAFEDVTIVINGSKSITKKDVGGTAEGDPDGSFDPGGKPGEQLKLIEDGIMTASANEEIEIPVKLDKNHPIGGMGLVLKYPADLIEITGVGQNSQNIDLYIYNGEVRVIWIDQSLGNSMKITDDNTLFTLKARMTEKFDMSSSVHFTMGIYSDIIGEKGKKISELGVLLPVINWSPDVEEYLTNYPNPCVKSTEIAYSVPFGGKVSICLYNITGEKLTTIVEEYQNPGYYSKQIDISEFETGIYLYQLNVEGIQNVTLSRRMIIAR